MDIHHKHKTSMSIRDKDDFKKKLEESLGSLQADIYQTEFGEVTMQQRFHKSI